MLGFSWEWGRFGGGEGVGGRGEMGWFLEQNEAKGGGNDEAARQREGRCFGKIHPQMQMKTSVDRVHGVMPRR